MNTQRILTFQDEYESICRKNAFCFSLKDSQSKRQSAFKVFSFARQWRETQNKGRAKDPIFSMQVPHGKERIENLRVRAFQDLALLDTGIECTARYFPLCIHSHVTSIAEVNQLLLGDGHVLCHALNDEAIFRPVLACRASHDDEIILQKSRL